MCIVNIYIALTCAATANSEYAARREYASSRLSRNMRRFGEQRASIQCVSSSCVVSRLTNFLDVHDYRGWLIASLRKHMARAA